MTEKPNIKSALLKALYVIVVCYILLNIFFSVVCFSLTDAWTYEDADGFPIVGCLLLVYSAILNFITGFVVKKFSKIPFWIHEILAIICLVTPFIILIE